MSSPCSIVFSDKNIKQYREPAVERMSMSDTAVIVDAVRTPIGRKNGALADVHPVDLTAHVLDAILQRTGLEPSQVDDVIWGCVTQIGAQSSNVGRLGALAA